MSDTRITSDEIRVWAEIASRGYEHIDWAALLCSLADQIDADAALLAERDKTIVRLEVALNSRTEECLSRQNAHSMLAKQYENELRRVAELEAELDRRNHETADSLASAGGVVIGLEARVAELEQALREFLHLYNCWVEDSTAGYDRLIEISAEFWEVADVKLRVTKVTP